MTSNQPNHSSRVWARYVGATLAGVAAISVVGAAALPHNGSDDTPPAPTTAAATAPTAATAVTGVTTPARPAHLIVEDEIDRAIAERQTGG